MRGAALPDVAAWAQPGRTWAPAVVRTRTGYLLYYTVRHRDWGHQCISVAHAASPTGPYAGWDTGDIGPPNPRRLHLGELIVTSDAVTVAPL